MIGNKWVIVLMAVFFIVSVGMVAENPESEPEDYEINWTNVSDDMESMIGERFNGSHSSEVMGQMLFKVIDAFGYGVSESVNIVFNYVHGKSGNQLSTILYAILFYILVKTIAPLIKLSLLLKTAYNEVQAKRQEND